MTKNNFQSQVEKAHNTSERLDTLINKVPELISARDYGVDIWMLLTNLNRPVVERIKRHQIALNTFHKLQNAQKL